MNKSIKLQNNIYLDSTSVVHKKESLNNLLENLKPVLLFDNSAGAVNGEIKENGTTANFSSYKFVEIYTSLNTIIKMYNPNGKTGVTTAWGWGDTIYIYRMAVSCNNSTFTTKNEDVYIYNGGAVGHRTATYKVFQIIGYK